MSLVAQPIFVQNEFKGTVLLISPISGVEQMVNQVNLLFLAYSILISSAVPLVGDESLQEENKAAALH